MSAPDARAAAIAPAGWEAGRTLREIAVELFGADARIGVRGRRSGRRMTRHPARRPARPVPDAAVAESRDDGTGSADERPDAGPASVRWHGALGRPLEPFLGVAERASRFVLPGSASFGKADGRGRGSRAVRAPVSRAAVLEVQVGTDLDLHRAVVVVSRQSCLSGSVVARTSRSGVMVSFSLSRKRAA